LSKLGPVSPQTVVVTGASTGIGRACALHLDHLGWNVFAGVRKDADGRALARDASARLVAVNLDVTDSTSINESVRRVADATGERGLDALVNNAGITVQGPLEYLELDDLRKQFEVNVVGQLAVTQAFLPALRVAKGRVVFMSSISGRASALPLIGPYAASKRALEALAESLRSELMPWDISVSLVEPGSIATPIWEKGDKTIDGLIDDLPPEGKARYERAMARGRDLAAKTGKRGIPPERVAAKVEHALTASRPHFRYLVGVDAKARAFMEPAVPTWVRDRAVARMLGYPKRPD
jgi:NAD(P)-dependent dehydrogenase (short-subunit alcohol dehydrogenase family)